MLSINNSPPIFLDNKYAKCYLRLIERARNRVKTGYVEKHHIWPLKLGGPDNVQNLVSLTAREHFIVHELLTKFTEGEMKRCMCYAVSFFRTNNKNLKRTLTARQYEVTRQALSDARRGVPPSRACRAAVSKARKGIPVSQEAKDKISKKLQIQHNVFVFDGASYFQESDFYRYCKSEIIGRANIQAKMQNEEIAVITAGKHKGKAFSFNDVGIMAMREAIITQCAEAKINRTKGIKDGHISRAKKIQTPKIQKTIQVLPDTNSIFNTSSPILFELPGFSAINGLLKHNIHELNIQILNNDKPYLKLDLHLKKQREYGKHLVFFEDELLNRNHLVLSSINNALGLNKKINARECLSCELTSTEARNFLKLNHLQGAGGGSTLNLGLKHKDVLVSVMTFGKARYTEADWELLRFASTAGFTIVGGASKLMSYAKRQLHGRIVSYADLRYGSGNVYLKLGFTFKHNSKPGYWYVHDDGKRHHRSQFQKHKLQKLLPSFDPALTEIQNMTNAGWKRVFDAGCAVFVLQM